MTTYNENNVPILLREPGSKLGMSKKRHEDLQAAHQAAIEAIEGAHAARAGLSEHGLAAIADPDSDATDPLVDAHDEHLYAHHAVLVQNPDPDRPPFTAFSIGASTRDEAVKEVVGAFDQSHVGPPDQSADHVHTPEWVASSSEDLAADLADYYGCAVRELSEVI